MFGQRCQVWAWGWLWWGNRRCERQATLLLQTWAPSLYCPMHPSCRHCGIAMSASRTWCTHTSTSAPGSCQKHGSRRRGRRWQQKIGVKDDTTPQQSCVKLSILPTPPDCLLSARPQTTSPSLRAAPLCHDLLRQMCSFIAADGASLCDRAASGEQGYIEPLSIFTVTKAL